MLFVEKELERFYFKKYLHKNRHICIINNISQNGRQRMDNRHHVNISYFFPDCIFSPYYLVFLILRFLSLWVCLVSVSQSVCLSVRLSVSFSPSLSLSLSLSLYIYIYVCVCVCVSFSLSIFLFLFLYLSIFCFFITLFLHWNCTYAKVNCLK